MPHEAKISTAAISTNLHFAAVQIDSSADADNQSKSWQSCITECPDGQFNENYFTFNELAFNSTVTVQVLAVYMDDTTLDVYTYYGKSAPTRLENENQAIVIDNLTRMDSNGEHFSYVAGRFLTGENSGPTGNVEVTYHPDGENVMNVELDSIINGYFQFVLLPGATMSYKLAKKGTTLFDKVSYDELRQYLQDRSQNVVHATFPPMSLLEIGTDGIPVEKQSANLPVSLFLGQYGNNNSLLDGYGACYSSSADGQSALDFGTIGLYTDASGDFGVLYELTGATTSVPVTPTNLLVAGGIDSSNALCAVPTDYPTGFFFDSQAYIYGGVKATTGFSGPFQLLRSAGMVAEGFIKMTHDPSARTIQFDWSTIAGINLGENGISGIAVYKSDISQGNRVGSLYNCSRLSEKGILPIHTTNENTFTYEMASGESLDNLDFAFCAYTGSATAPKALGPSMEMGIQNFSGSLSAECGSQVCVATNTLYGDLILQSTTAAPTPTPTPSPTPVTAADSGLIAFLDSAGNITYDPNGSPMVSTRSNPTVTSVTDPLVDVGDDDLVTVTAASAFTDGDGNQSTVSPIIQSVAASFDNSKRYGLLANGQITEIDNNGDPTGTCDLDACSIPAWMQSFSIGSGNTVFALDHGGNLHRIDNAGGSAEVIVADIPRYVTQVIYYQ